MILSPPLVFALCAGSLLVAGLVFAALPPAGGGAPRGLRARRWSRLVSAAALLALVRFDPPGLRLAIDPSTEPMLPAHDPAKDDYRAAVRDFGDDEVYVIAMETADVFTAENLAALRQVSDRIAKLPEVREVKSLVRVTSFRWVPADDWIEIRPLIEEIPSDPEALAALRARAVERSAVPAHAGLRGRPHGRAQRLVPQDDRSRVHRRRPRRPHPAHPRRGDAATAGASTWPGVPT